MRRFYQKEKNLLKLNYFRRKQFKDPYFNIHGKDQGDLKIYKNARAILNTARAESAYSSNEVVNEEYHHYIKVKHLVGYFRHNRSPFWFRGLSLNFLLDLYNKWMMQAKKLNQDYYLRLWVYDQDFTQSQIVFGVNARAKRYENMFDKQNKNQNIPFLTKELESKLFDFNVEFCKDLYPLTTEDLTQMKTDDLAFLARDMGYQINKNLFLKQNSAIDNLDSFIDCGFIELSGNDDDVYLSHFDNVWVIGKESG